MKKETAIPKHIAIIMDGNRRWAKTRGLPAIAGHRYVADKILESLVEYAAKCGILYITFWAWSTENWERNKDEVTGIMRIFRHVIHNRWNRLHERGVRIRIIGDTSKFESDIRESLEKVIEITKDNKRITAVFALNYGGRDETLRAVNRLLQHPTSNVQHPASKPQDRTVTEEQFSGMLDTAGMPDPDMIIRTGGEQRLSGFLPWQSEYSEFYFPPWYMPDFTPEKLDEVLEEYAKRKRRYGK